MKALQSNNNLTDAPWATKLGAHLLVLGKVMTLERRKANETQMEFLQRQLETAKIRISALEDAVRALQNVVTKDSARLAANGTTKRGSRRG